MTGVQTCALPISSSMLRNSGTAPIPVAEVVVPPLPEIKSQPAIAMEPAPATIVKPATPVTRSGRGATVSIHRELTAIGEKKKSEEKVAIAPVEITALLSIQEIASGIKTLTDLFISQGRQQLAMAMTMHDARVLEGNIIEFCVGNALQSDEIQSARPEIVGWFRKNLSAP